MEQAKLSKFQRWILLAAHQKALRPRPENKNPRSRSYAERPGLANHEILRDYFGFPERKPRGWPHFPVIDRKAVGDARFNAANSTMVRAKRRLRQRGLLEPGLGTYTYLTEEGVATARELLDNGHILR